MTTFEQSYAEGTSGTIQKPAEVTLPNLALLGKAGAGKDKAAALLYLTYGYNRSAFADRLKDVAEAIWGPTARTSRDKLQRLGVAVRDIDPDAWVNALTLTNPAVVTDVRFPNEVRALLALGFVTVRIDAPRGLRLNRLRDNGKLEDESQLDHISEIALDSYPVDYVVVNDEGEIELNNQLVKVVERERQRRG